MATFPPLSIAGADDALAEAVGAALGRTGLRCLVNADPEPDPPAVVARCQDFVADVPAGADALIVTILRASPPGLDHVARHAATAALWAFTRAAALDWAPRRIRVNAIGLGRPPFGPFEAASQAGRAAFDAPASPASLADIARTLHAMSGWLSMTGQIVRLGDPPPREA